MKCPHCDSSEIQFTSRVREYPTQIMEFHLNIMCHNCSKYFFITKMIETKGVWKQL